MLVIDFTVEFDSYDRFYLFVDKAKRENFTFVFSTRIYHILCREKVTNHKTLLCHTAFCSIATYLKIDFQDSTRTQLSNNI